MQAGQLPQRGAGIVCWRYGSGVALYRRENGVTDGLELWVVLRSQDDHGVVVAYLVHCLVPCPSALLHPAGNGELDDPADRPAQAGLTVPNSGDRLDRDHLVAAPDRHRAVEAAALNGDVPAVELNLAVLALGPQDVTHDILLSSTPILTPAGPAARAVRHQFTRSRS